MGGGRARHRRGPVEKWIMHYSSSHKILLVGEGDFSFAACLARAFGSAANMVATSLDNKGWLLQTYTRAEENLKELKERGCRVVHGVDASTMSEHPLLLDDSFDRIVFNFPHDGFGYRYYREEDSKHIERHQDLVSEFLSSAYEMVTERGEIHITHKTAYPFSEWDIVWLAEEEGLFLKEEADFYLEDYPGYVNKKGSGPNCDRTFPVGLCSTYKFVDSRYKKKKKKKKKKKDPSRFLSQEFTQLRLFDRNNGNNGFHLKIDWQ